MKKITSFFCGLFVLSMSVISCQDSDVDEPETTQSFSDSISFTASVSTRATDTMFVSGDQIAVWAFDESDDSYSESVLYSYSNSLFSSSTPIAYTIEDGETYPLSFYTLYPYGATLANNIATFEVKQDQSEGSNFSLSDLMASSVSSTTSLKPELSFEHLLSKVTVTVVSSDHYFSNDTATLELSGKASVNLVSENVSTSSSLSTITMASNGEMSYKAIVAPQIIDAGTVIGTLKGSDEYSYDLTIADDFVFSSGSSYVIEVSVFNGVATCATPQSVTWVDDPITETPEISAMLRFTAEELALPGKKGVCFTQRDPESYSSGTWTTSVPKMKALQPWWNYSWATTLINLQPTGIEFVPMFWSGASTAEAVSNAVAADFASGRTKRLMGFNEPDSSDQSNIAVATAIERWPYLEAMNVPLCSPSCTDNATGLAWIQSFMELAMENKYRVDYIGVHWYQSTVNLTTFQNRLSLTQYVWYKDEDGYITKESTDSEGNARSRIPLILTEFAVVDWGTSDTLTEAQVITFMESALPWLDSTDWIAGYAWFSFGVSSTAPYSALFESDNIKLTALGEVYANHTPNYNTYDELESVSLPSTLTLSPNDTQYYMTVSVSPVSAEYETAVWSLTDVSPAGCITIDSSTGRIDCTGVFGTATVNVTVTDSYGNSASASCQVEISELVNLVQNAGFEEEDGSGGALYWTPHGDNAAAVEYVTGDEAINGRTMRIYREDSTSCEIRQVISVNVTPGVTYRYGFTGRSQSVIGAEGSGTGQNNLNVAFQEQLNDEGTSWNRFSAATLAQVSANNMNTTVTCEFTVPESYAYTSARLNIWTSVPIVAYIDDIFFYEMK
ncbi:MAG: glycosyl hydrolase [Rikenellaceae bacterium]